MQWGVVPCKDTDRLGGGGVVGRGDGGGDKGRRGVVRGSGGVRGANLKR